MRKLWLALGSAFGHSPLLGVPGGILLVIIGVIFLRQAEGKFEDVYSIYHIVMGGMGLTSPFLARDKRWAAVLGQVAAAGVPWAVGSLRLEGVGGGFGPFDTELLQMRVTATTLLLLGALGAMFQQTLRL